MTLTSTAPTALRGKQAYQTILCESLHQLPEQLSLTPVRNKAAKRDNWQNEPTIPRSKLTILLEQGERTRAKNGGWYQQEYTGYGLRTGSVSGGVFAVDVDGLLADDKLNEISGGELPQTPAWTSGKPFCKQLAFQLSETTQAVLDAVGFTRHFIDCGNGQQLDFRYNGCQSVLPPSRHPETGQYQWIVSFTDCSIATAPEWLELQLIEWALQQENVKPKRNSTPEPILKGNREPAQGSDTQLWGNKPAPGRIASNEGLMIRWNQIRITGKGQTNSVLLEFSRLLKESGIDCETAIAEFRHFSMQIPGYPQYASRASRRDLENGTWAERIVVNWFKRDGYSGHLAKRDSGLNQIRQDSALRRISEAVSEGLNQGLTKVGKWIDWIQDYCYRKWGIKPGLKTLYQHLELWHPKHKNNPPPKDHRVELRRGVKDSITARVREYFTPPQSKQLSPKLSFLTWQAIAVATALKLKPETSKKRDRNAAKRNGHSNVTPKIKPPNQVTEANKIVTLCSAATFRTGDRVILDDRTGANYCGKECTITAVLPDGTYRLDITYTGKRLRPRQTKNAFEAFPSFLRHAPSCVTPRDNSIVHQDNQGTKPDNPTGVWVSASDIQRLKIPASHWLYAICGGAKQRVRPDEVDQSIWRQLLTVGGAANA